MPESDLDFLISISLSALVHPTIATENPVRSNMGSLRSVVGASLPLEQNKNYVNSWLHGALNGARSVIANFEGARRARRRATMGAVKFRSRLDRKKPAAGFPARAQFSIFAMMKICR